MARLPSPLNQTRSEEPSVPGLHLEQVVDIIESLDHRNLAVHHEQCTRARHRRSSCIRCQDACPTAAISLDRGPTIDRERCTGCGICATLCPTGALEARSPGNDELLAMALRALRDRDWVSFACSPAIEAGCGSAACIPVGCLGRIDESILVSAVARGADAVWLIQGDCAGCVHAGGETVARAAVDRSNALLLALGRRPCVIMAEELPISQGLSAQTSGQEVSRRGFFKAIARGSTRLGDVTLQSLRTQDSEDPRITKPGEGLPFLLPFKRRLLLDGLRRLGDSASSEYDAGSEGLWADIAFNETCTACQMCGFFCPTGALSMVVQDGQLGVSFRLAECTNCGLCREVCYRDAVVSTSIVNLDRIIDPVDELLCLRQQDDTAWRQASQERIYQHIAETLNR